MERIVIIANPSAGRAHSIEALLEELAVLPNHSFREVGKGESPTQVARNAIADGVKTIVAAGGDGTLHAVVCGIADLGSVTVGLIPLGTGNDLARSLHIPTDLASAVAVIAAGKTRAIDLIHVEADSGARWCVNASAGGFAGIVDEKLSHAKTGWLGPLAYFGSALEALRDIPEYRIELTLGDEVPLTLTGCNVVVANGRSVAGGVIVAPNAVLDDGLMDVAVFKATSAGELALLVPSLLAGVPVDPDRMFYARGRRVRVATTPPAPFNSDGELIGEGPVTYEVRPGALRMLVP
ncbi:MAG: diacylglycerol kinase family lipid kinase [Clostridia bacterium]|nr:diacylglycerol kinase family lipid kinase [Deltaproteobacteria bacterium]